MASIKINTSKKVIPMIYSYTTPGITYHEGWSKIGYTERDVETRIKEQTHTAGIKYHIDWKGLAIFDDGSGRTFTDRDFHTYLRKNDIKQEPGDSNEWFLISLPESKMMFEEFRSNGGIKDTGPALDYTLRNEQNDAVKITQTCFVNGEHREFLWNAKPRFGKTLSVYDLCKRLEAKNVLIVTNRPAVANSWYSDYSRFMGTDSGYRFVSEVYDLRDKPYTITHQDFERIRTEDPQEKCLEFVSLQDLKGSIYFGGKYEKLKHIVEENWDLLVIDEAHEGVDTFKTDVAFDHIKRKWTLHLSGTPFKALANSKFPEDAIYNWTYLDEQKAKKAFKTDSGNENPYENLPKLTMLTYRMSDIVAEEISQGIELNGETIEYAFDLNEFFATDNIGRFVHDKEVDKFLDALTIQSKYPFSSPDFRNQLKHTLWLLDRVSSAKAMARKLKKHTIFSQYEIIVAAGDGKLDEDDVEANIKAFDKVVKSIKEKDKTITLSVGQLTTGVTIPEWTAVLMLSNLKSPAQYMQAAFRVQNPCLFIDGHGEFYRKENSYVFDFDPARTLNIYEQFANDLSSDTSSGKGDVDTRKEHVRELLNFFPVIGEDSKGVMEELDAEKILSIPRKIRSLEVVRRGFMSDFLFQNIGRIFNAPPQARDIIFSFRPVKEEGPLVNTELFLNEMGDIDIPEKIVIGTAKELFGEKRYKMDMDDIREALEKEEARLEKPEEIYDAISKKFVSDVVTPMIDIAKTTYGADLTPSIANQIQRKLGDEVKIKTKKLVSDIKIAHNVLDLEKQEKLQECIDDRERRLINKEYLEKTQAKTEELTSSYKQDVDDITNSVGEKIVGDIVKHQQEKSKASAENVVRSHLRGFSRTIPSFLMAYGDESTTLATFDTIVPNEVFEEVTGITLKDFRFLRDGGDYKNEETEDIAHFEGHMFDPVVFDDSIKEFMSLKKKLANYFDESQTGDIFDYIPPQQTNQIFTPKSVVKEMIDLLERQNPGCYDDENSTFADLYMKSGLYIAEIIKKLYRSERLKELYPEPAERLNHIFSKQVYGMAPTEIIYRIARSYLLGFNEDIIIEKDNIRLCDSFKYAENGTLSQKICEEFNIKRDDE